MTSEDGSLEDLDGSVLDLADVVAYQSGSIVSRTLVDEKSATLTAFALDDGQRISEHSAPHVALFQVLDGTAAITIDGDERVLEAGESIFMPPNVPHAVDAPSRFKMLLTMVR